MDGVIALRLVVLLLLAGLVISLAASPAFGGVRRRRAKPDAQKSAARSKASDAEAGETAD